MIHHQRSIVADCLDHTLRDTSPPVILNEYKYDASAIVDEGVYSHLKDLPAVCRMDSKHNHQPRNAR